MHEVNRSVLPHHESLSLPISVQVELDRRRRDLLERATGSVLDVSEPSGRRLLHDAYESVSPDGSAPVYDTVITVACLPLFPDLSRAVSRLVDMLAPGGQLLFVEPFGRAGWRGLVAASVTARSGNLGGLHLNRDLTLALRSGGLIVTDIERFTMPTHLWPLRHFAAGRALRACDLEPDAKTETEADS